MSTRIPQFKAWHITEKKMCKAYNINDKGAFLVGVAKGKDQVTGRITVVASTKGRFCEYNEIELLECTNLKDLSGRLVFEGDIVKLESGNIRKVVYRKFGFWLDAIHENANFPICFFKENDINTFEIIGNIYENENLLA